jgi:hypothetical protein
MAPILLSRFGRFYNSSFDRRPVPTLIVTNGVLYAIADGLVSEPRLGRSLRRGALIVEVTCDIEELVREIELGVVSERGREKLHLQYQPGR